MKKNTYDASLVNKEGCNFDNARFTNLEKAKSWASGRGKGYRAYIKTNYDPELDVSEEEIVIEY